MKRSITWRKRPWKLILTEAIAEGIVVCVLGLLLSAAWAAVTEGAAAVTCSIETDKSALQANETQKVVAKVTLKAAQTTDARDRSPVNLSVVLDRSGSMRGEKIDKAKEAAIEALKRLTPRDVFSLVIYDHIVETLIPAQHVKDIDGIATKIKGIDARRQHRSIRRCEPGSERNPKTRRGQICASYYSPVRRPGQRGTELSG